MKRALVWPVLSTLYAVAIFIGSAIPAPDLPQVVAEFSDKVLHISEYAVFGFLLHRAFRVQPWLPRLASHAIVTAGIISLVYGASDEIHQLFVPGRSADMLDWVADSCGALLGVFSSWLLLRLTPTSSSKPA